MTDQTPNTDSKKYRLIELIVDPLWDKLSHTRLINLTGALTGSAVMIWLMILDKMTEGYLGLYMGAVGLTAVGLKVASRDPNPTVPSKPSE